MFKTFSGTLTGQTVTLTGSQPTAGWVVFNDSPGNVYEFVVDDPLTGSATFKIGPREIQKIQTADVVVTINGTGAYRAICFQSLTSFRFYNRTADNLGTPEITYYPDNETLEVVAGPGPAPVMQIRDEGVTEEKLSQELQDTLALVHDVDDSTLGVSEGGELEVKDEGITQAKLAQEVIDLISGAGGLTVIQDAGEMSGTYEGSVLCLGSAVMVDDVEIKGDLYQAWYSTYIITNTGGHNLVVYGSANIHSYSNYPDDTEQPNGNIEIYGSFTFANCAVYSSGGSSSMLRVGGGCVANEGANSLLNLNGLDNSPATELKVYGDVSLGAIDGYGDGANKSSKITVYGNLNVTQNINVANGDPLAADDPEWHVEVYGNLVCGGIDGSGSPSFGGCGHRIEVSGDMRVEASTLLYGGDYSSGSAGNGGSLTVRGSYISWDGDLQLHGGLCESADASHTSGQAGDIEVYGDLIVASISAHGGVRQGSPATSSPSNVPPHGGDLLVYGSLITGGVDLSGGDVTTTDDLGSGGDGGDFTVHGSVKSMGMALINLSGGNCSTTTATASKGGDSGTATFYSSALVESIHANGGNSGSSTPTQGSAGHVYFYNGVTCGSMEILDGTGVTPATNACGVQFSGSCCVTDLNVVGRSGSKITGAGATILKVAGLSTKDTFDNPEDVVTDAIINPDTQLFIYGDNAGWYALQGATMVGG